jgi:hypothetical protein
MFQLSPRNFLYPNVIIIPVMKFSPSLVYTGYLRIFYIDAMHPTPQILTY